MKNNFKAIIFSFFSLIISAQGFSQEINFSKKNKDDNRKTKLLVGIVIDQMRYDYITRYWDYFGDDGFKKLIDEGFLFKNHHYGYVPTFTAPGHASIYTGSTPRYHGIIANDWYDREKNKLIYCSADTSYKALGSKYSYQKVSPKKLQSTTLSDEIKLASNHKAKCIGIGMKDRSALFAAGFIGDAAYWFSGNKEGFWIGSSFYQDSLPEWVQNFNNSGRSKYYLNQEWDLIQQKENYSISMEDNNAYEKSFSGKDSPTFPYKLKELSKANRKYDLLKKTPFGMNLTLEFALSAMESEELGRDDITDFIGISFSSTDYIGHAFGPYSREVQDCYLRLDLVIAELISNLNTQVGEGNYTIFLTADHGVSPVPNHLKSLDIPGGYFNPGNLEEDIESHLNKKYEKGDWVKSLYNEQIYLNLELIKQLNLEWEVIAQDVAYFCKDNPAVYSAIINDGKAPNTDPKTPEHKVYMGLHPSLSGEVALILKPGWLYYGMQGSSHGSAYNYDSHVPLILYGHGIKQGSTSHSTYTRDVAATVSELIGISPPSASIGQSLMIYIE